MNRFRRLLVTDVGAALAISLAVGVFLAVSGAFGSERQGLGERLIYWLPLMVVGALWGVLCARIVDRVINPDERPWLAATATTLAISGPLAVFVWAATGLFLERRPYPLEALPQFILPVLMITAAITAISTLAARRPVQTHAAVDHASARFLDRLPFKLRGAAIHAVQAEDHYLRIHTERGSDLILMRLSDALEELEGLEGSQTHRSWWVAKDAVIDVSRGDGRATLTLKDGITAPVSRRYARALREAGWY